MFDGIYGSMGIVNGQRGGMGRGVRGLKGNGSLREAVEIDLR